MGGIVHDDAHDHAHDDGTVGTPRKGVGVGVGDG